MPRITVRTPFGRTYNREFSLSKRFLDVKEYAEEEENINIKYLVLKHHGKVMENSSTLNEHLKNEDTVLDLTLSR